MAEGIQIETVADQIATVEQLEAKLAVMRAAQREFATYSQEKVDKIFYEAAMAANKARIPLAKMAVAETGMGVVEDKVIKNHYAAEYIYNAYRNTKTCGVLEENAAYGIKKIAEPIGLIAAVIPTTNPTSTAIFKTLICLKTRNAIIISPHPRAKESTIEAARIVYEAAVNSIIHSKTFDNGMICASEQSVTVLADIYDAVKIMWVMYEHPDVNFEDMAMDFMDIRKRVYEFPEMGKKAYFVAIPTSSGTGSEVTPFAIITDENTGTKWPLADYQLLPNMAIVDVDNMMNQPKGLTSASGIDVFTHACEAYVSVMATDMTDGLALKATKNVFDYLPRAYANGANDLEARDHMAMASTLAGMAFANAFLGLNHSMAHKLGAYHHIPHGIANALVLTYVMRYNANEVPTKMGTFPQYEYPHARARYCEIARYNGIVGKDDEETFGLFIEKVEELKRAIDIPASIKDWGIKEEDFLATLDEMTESAFNDQCTGANPRYPLMSEMKELYLMAYYGKDTKEAAKL